MGDAWNTEQLRKDQFQEKSSGSEGSIKFNLPNNLGSPLSPRQKRAHVRLRS